MLMGVNFPRWADTFLLPGRSSSRFFSENEAGFCYKNNEEKDTEEDNLETILN